MNRSCDEANLEAIRNILQLGAERMLEHYRMRKDELALEEARLKESMDPAVRKVVEEKNLLLFREVMSDAGVVDQELFSYMLRVLETSSHRCRAA